MLGRRRTLALASPVHSHAWLRRISSGGIGGVSDGPPRVFNRKVKGFQRDAAAMRADRGEYSLLRDIAAENLVDRLDDTLRKFPNTAEVGCADGAVLRALGGYGRGGIKRLVQCDHSNEMLELCQHGRIHDVDVSRVRADEEALPFADESLDLVLSNLSLHWINDVPGTLIQMRRALRPDGLMLASMLGGDTLFELRRSLVMSGLERYGGVSASLSPLAGVQDAGNLLGRAGFALPAVDMDTHTFTFPDALSLMYSLQGMGENNAIFGAEFRHVSRDALLAAAAVYDSLYKGPDGVTATFQIIYMSGWAPHESQQRAKARGSAELSLSDLGTFQTVFEGDEEDGMPGAAAGGNPLTERIPPGGVPEGGPAVPR